MAYIFLDESGDLGFDFSKRRTSKFFIVTLLFVPGAKGPIEKVVKKTHIGLRKRHRNHSGVLHAFHEKPITRQRLLRRLAEKDCTVMAIYLNKRKVYTMLQNEKQVLYNYVTNILLDRIYTKHFVPSDKTIHLVAAQRETNKFLNDNFRNYLCRQMQGNHKADVKVVIATPSREKCLQAVDFVSWALFRKYEYGDTSYSDIFKSLIVEENPLFP